MDKFIDIDGLKLHYTVEGSGQPMILMHGWGCTAATLASIAATARSCATVYGIDFPGFGQSSEPSEVWGVEEYTQLLEKFAAQLNIERPILLGHSFGGRVGLLYSSRNPVEKLILVDAAGVKPRRSLKYYFKVWSFKIGKKWIRMFHSAEEAERRIEKARKARGSSDYGNASPMMRRILSKVVNEDLKHVMPLIQAPTLLVWGHNDTATPIRDAKIMQRLIPDAGLVDFPGCGHYSFLDNPRQFAAVLESFLNS